MYNGNMLRDNVSYPILQHPSILLLEVDISELTAGLDRLKSEGVLDCSKYLDLHPQFIAEAVHNIRIVDANDATLRLFGAERMEQLLGPLDAILDPGAIAYFKDLIISLFGGRRFHKMEIAVRTLQGKNLDVLASSSIPAEDGSSAHMLVHVIDISERKGAEMALLEEKLFSDAVIASAPGIFFVIDEQGHFVRWNRNEEEVTGYSRDELLKVHALDTIAPEDRASVAEGMREVFEKGSTAREIRGLGKAGNTRLTLLSGVRAEIGGRKYIVGMGSDLTERTRAEEERRSLSEQLAQAQKMESIGRLAGGIAHDFNNLLTGIMGNISLVLSDLDSRDARYPALADAEKAAQSARELTRQLLAFSRKDIVEPKVTDLNALIEGMLRMLERIIGAGIELRAITQPDLWNVRVDQGQVNQIIVNLVVNARDAMPHGGRLTIETRNVTLVGGGHGARAMAEPGNYVMLEVSDTGTGMTDEVKSHIFEPFFTTKERGKGTGLGLAMVYGAVRQNCGIIEADSEVGRGAAFRMLFPRVNEEVEAITQRAASDEVVGGTETILLVEDEPLVNSLAARLLTKLGYTVISCPDWRKALAASRAYDGRIQLLITDTVMPGMSGKMLAAELLRERPEMRVLFTSGYPEELVGENGMREGGFAFIGKPFTIQALGQKVREVLES